MHQAYHCKHFEGQYNYETKRISELLQTSFISVKYDKRTTTVLIGGGGIGGTAADALSVVVDVNILISHR